MMKLKYLKRICKWKECKIKISKDKCSVGDFLDKLHLPRIGWDIIVNSVSRSCDYILKENDVIVLMQKEIGRA